MLVVFFTLVATSIEMAFVAAQLPTRSVSAAGYDVSSVFFAFYGVTSGWLVIRSGFLPRVIGALLMVGSLSYLAYGFTDILAPTSAASLVPWIQLPSLAGELSFTLWLLIAGLNVERWLAARRTAEVHAGADFDPKLDHSGRPAALRALGSRRVALLVGPPSGDQPRRLTALRQPWILKPATHGPDHA